MSFLFFLNITPFRTFVASFLLCYVFYLTAGVVQAQPAFVNLGDLPGGKVFSTPPITSGDEAAVVGYRPPVNVVVNGDFEAGLANWEVVEVNPFIPGGDAPHYPVMNVKDSHHCPPGYEWTNHVYLDVPHEAEGYIQQVVDLPEGQAELRFMTWGNFDPVNATVSIVDANGQNYVLDSFTPPTTEIEGGCSGAAPVEKTYDLTGFAGQQIALRFRATSNNGIGAFANFDDIVIETNPESGECSMRTYTWVPDRGISFESPDHWDPAGPPSDGDIARFDTPQFVPVDLRVTRTNDMLEVVGSRVQMNLFEQFYTLTGESNCGPALLVEGSATELELKGDGRTFDGTLNAQTEALIASGSVSITDGAALTSRELRIGESGSTTLHLDHGVIRALDRLEMALAEDAEVEMIIDGAAGSANLLLAPTVDIGVRGSATLQLTGQTQLLGPVLNVPDDLPLEVRLGVEANSTGIFELIGSDVTAFEGDFDRYIRFVVGDRGVGTLNLQDGAGMRIDDLKIGDDGSGEVRLLEGGVLVVDSTLSMGESEGAVATLVLSSGQETSGIAIGGLAFIGLAGTATVNLQGDAIFSNALSDADTTKIFLGGFENGEGNLVVAGGELVSVDVPIEVTVGARGRGDVQVTEGGSIDVEELWIGRADTGFGSVFVGGEGASLHADRLAVGPGAFGLLQVAEDGLVTTDLLWVADNGQVQGDVIAVGTFDAGKRAAGIEAGGLLLAENAQLDVTTVDFAPDAVIGGTATWVSPIVNSGGVMPGDLASPGVFTAGAGYEQTAEGFLEIELGAGGHDKLSVAGTAVLDGALRVSLLDDYVPAIGASFVVLEADEIAGAFATVEATPGLEIEVHYTGMEVTLEISAVTVASEPAPASVLPAGTRLLPNFPNPFHGQTTLAFELEGPSRVQLAVYDMLGREVARLFEGALAAGRHEVAFDAGELPSGAYLSRLTTAGGDGRPGAHLSRQLVLIR